MTLSDLRSIVASDVLVACIFPILILFLGYRLLPGFSLSDIRDLVVPSSISRRQRNHYGYFSLERAYTSFSQYERLSRTEVNRMRASYSKLGRTGKNLGYKIGYPKKLDRLEEVTAMNTTITESIAELAAEEFPSRLAQGSPGSKNGANSADLGRVRESLKHFVRDWSEEGATERERIFTPILDVLKKVSQDSRADMKVLVPGCGLGRLAWEISQLGFDTTANELSFFMTLALRFLFSPRTTKDVNEHVLRPYAHWFSHQRSNASLFRTVAFPDTVPRFTANFHLIEDDFLKLPVPLPSEDPPQTRLSRTWIKGTSESKGTGGYDFIVTLFFIDTSLDFFSTLSHIHKLLKPGGTWINLGPLLWTGGTTAKVELSLEEVLLAAEEVGFLIESRDREGASGEREKSTIVECEYTGDRNAMMRWIYKAEFWVARKAEQI